MSIKKQRDYQVTLGLTCKLLNTIPSRFIHPVLFGLFGNEICGSSIFREQDVIDCYEQIPLDVKTEFMVDFESQFHNDGKDFARLFYLSFLYDTTIKEIPWLGKPEIVPKINKFNKALNRNIDSTRCILFNWIKAIIGYELDDRFKIMKIICSLPCYLQTGMEARLYLGFTFTDDTWVEEYTRCLRPLVRTIGLRQGFKAAKHDLCMFVSCLKEEIKRNEIPSSWLKVFVPNFRSTIGLSRAYSEMDVWCLYLSALTPFFVDALVVFGWFLTRRQKQTAKEQIIHFSLDPQEYIEKMLKNIK